MLHTLFLQVTTPLAVEWGKDLSLIGLLGWLLWYFIKKMEAQQAARDAVMDKHIERQEMLFKELAARQEKIAEGYHTMAGKLTSLYLRDELDREKQNRHADDRP